jgi:hypothetical protein
MAAFSLPALRLKTGRMQGLSGTSRTDRQAKLQYTRRLPDLDSSVGMISVRKPQAARKVNIRDVMKQRGLQTGRGGGGGTHTGKEASKRVQGGNQQKGGRKEQTNCRNRGPRKVKGKTEFSNAYSVGMVPCVVTNGRLEWKKGQTPDLLDISTMLPMFYDGLRDPAAKVAAIAELGCVELLLHLQKTRSTHIMFKPNTWGALIGFLREAIRTQERKVLQRVCKVLCLMLKIDEHTGFALTPHYKPLLAPLSKYFEENTNVSLNLCAEIRSMVEMMEQHGGDDSFARIKYLIPTFESARDS